MFLKIHKQTFHCVNFSGGGGGGTRAVRASDVEKLYNKGQDLLGNTLNPDGTTYSGPGVSMAESLGNYANYNPNANVSYQGTPVGGTMTLGGFVPSQTGTQTTSQTVPTAQPSSAPVSSGTTYTAPVQTTTVQQGDPSVPYYTAGTNGYVPGTLGDPTVTQGEGGTGFNYWQNPQYTGDPAQFQEYMNAAGGRMVGTYDGGAGTTSTTTTTPGNVSVTGGDVRGTVAGTSAGTGGTSPGGSPYGIGGGVITMADGTQIPLAGYKPSDYAATPFVQSEYQDLAPTAQSDISKYEADLLNRFQKGPQAVAGTAIGSTASAGIAQSGCQRGTNRQQEAPTRKLLWAAITIGLKQPCANKASQD